MRGGSSGGRNFGGGGMHSSGGGGGGYRNPCLTMHQPWASLLVHGIKRVEGRSWPSPVTGRLWIHAASKVPDPDTVAAMEAFYREIHAVDGVAHIDFPQHYPVSRLLGCVEVVGCVRSEELVCWEDVPESVRLEGLTDFCWLCENPQKLVVPFEMRGYQGVYNLERRIYEGAVRGLSPVQGPLPVKFPLPDPRNPLSLKPGSLNFDSSKSTLVKTPSVSAAIAGARAAANQYSRKDNNAAAASSEIQTRNKSRESRADGGSGSGSLPSVVLDSPSHSQRQDPSLNFDSSKSPLVKAPSVSAAIAGARAAANQYSRNDNNAAATSSEIQTRNKSREYRADGGSGSCSLPSVVLYSPSHSQRQDPCPVVQNNPFDSRNQNHSAAATSSEILTWNKSREDCAGRSSESGILPSAVQDSPLHAQRQNPLSTVQNVPSYSQNQNPVSIVGSIPIYLQSQNPSSTVHNILSYPHYQIPVSIVGSIPIYSQGQNSPSVFCNIQPYSQNQNPHYSVQSSPSCSQIQNPSANVHNSAFYSHNRNLPSVVQNSASCSHSHDPSPSVQSHPSFLHNYNPSLTAQNNSSALQNQNAEPRRSPRLQNGASNRWR